MRRFTELLLCACLLAVPYSGIASETTMVPAGLPGFTNPGAHLSVSSGTPEVTSIALDVPAIEIIDHVEDFETYKVFSIPGEPVLFAEGNPTVPHVSRFYRLPNTGNVELVITAAEYDVLDNIDVYPVQIEQQNFSQFSKNSEVYDQDSWYPAHVAEMSAPMIMRDFRVATVSLFPVQVNPVTRQARIYHNIQVDLVSTGGQGENELLNPRQISGYFAPIYRSVIANLDENALDDVTTTPGTYLILCHTNNDAKKWADSLFLWKTRLGFPVHIEARSNWTKTTMVSYIQSAYSTWPNPPEYVCLIGDPSWTNGVETDDWGAFDHDYSRGNNGDQIPDIAVGRLSGNGTSEMATINAKIMGYERNPYMADTMWYHRGYFLGGVANDIASNYTLMQWGGQMFRNYTGVDSGIVEHVNGHVNDTRVQQLFNQGLSYFFWRGTWLSQMDASIVDPMTNGWKLPVCLLITCGANEFASGTGTAEAYLVKGTPTAPKGGVAATGTSTAGTHNPPNVCLAGGLMYNIANLGLDHLGMAFTGAKWWLFSTFVTTNVQDQPVNFCHYFNLMGDPGLSHWTDVPEVMNCTHPSIVNVGTRAVAVEAVRAADGVPIADALVVLWKRGADSTYVLGRTDTEGRITLPVNINATGDLWLTVSKKNHKPYLYTISCVQPEIMPMLSSYDLDDDNAGGSSGNNDGVMNPGETIDLPVYIKNFGISGAATGISAVLTSDDPRVTVVQGNASYVNLAAGDSALGSTPFRISVAPTMPHDESVLLTMAITSQMGTTNGAIELHCVAGAVKYINHAFTGGSFDPGTTRNLQVTVQNIGGQSMSTVTGRLVSLSPFVQVDAAQTNYGNIAVSQTVTNTAVPFTVSSNSLTFRGHQAPMLVITTTANGEIDTAQFVVNVGTAATTDPTGPDAYGYYAYDNTDTEYDLAPTFAYVDISSGMGTNLNLNDTGEKTTISQIWSTARQLPFGFKYYGTVYDSVTICSNGWIAFGNQSWNDMFRNYPIPAMQAPEAMIAPYWDDLNTSGSGRGVWAYFDATEHRYIVQWKAVGAFSTGSQLNFQVILYDTTYHPTLDGNGFILMQFQQVVLNLSGDSWEPQGNTTGIQAPRGTVGLGYLYCNQYTPGSAALVNNRAILYTTSARQLFGTIQGTVHDFGTTEPMEDVEITIDGYSYHTSTNSAGQYTIENVLIGTYTVRASEYRYNSATVSGVVVALDSTSTADFSLRHPEFATSVDSIVATASDQPVSESFDIINAGNGPLDYNITIYYAGDENPSPWDSVGGALVTEATEDYQIMGCEFVGDYWWISGGGGPDGQNKLYKFDLDGNLVGSIPQPSTTAVGWFDLAWDGELLYGSDGPDIIGIDTLGNVRRTIPSPMNPTRAIAYDPGSAHFWVCDYTQDFFEIDTLGNIINRIPNSGTNQLSVTGLAWNSTDANSYKLYIFSQNGTGELTRITRLNPISQLRETVIDLPGQSGDRAGGCTITPGWNSTLLVFGGIIQNSSGDRLGIYEMTFNTTWIEVTPAQFQVPGGGSRQINLQFDPEFLRPSRYRVNLHIRSEIYDSTAIFPVTLIVQPVAVSPAPDNELPTDFALYQNYPNPFNPTTTIRYDLKNDGMTRLAVYNLLGMRVAELVNERQSAGRHEVQFSAENLPSGMYFYRLESGDFSHTAKMILMK